MVMKDWRPMIRPHLPGNISVGKRGKHLPRGRGVRDVKLPPFRFLGGRLDAGGRFK